MSPHAIREAARVPNTIPTMARMVKNSEESKNRFSSARENMSMINSISSKSILILF